MESGKKHCTAVVLAAGSGRRMKSTTAKQFLLLDGKPIIWYSLQAVERSQIIDSCILVTGEGDIPYVQREIVGKYGFSKVGAVVAGGGERYESVYNALCVIAKEERWKPGREGYIFIHDGARPFLTEEILESTYQAVCRYRACVAAVPVKDTIKIADGDGFAVQTPDRNLVWAVQTPQVFEAPLIIQAYQKLFRQLESPGREEGGNGMAVTDDAMVVERLMGIPVKLVEASYGNIKITTPEDIRTAQSLIEERRLNSPRNS